MAALRQQFQEGVEEIRIMLDGGVSSFYVYAWASLNAFDNVVTFNWWKTVFINTIDLSRKNPRKMQEA